jgi:hypothetical protein
MVGVLKESKKGILFFVVDNNGRNFKTMMEDAIVFIVTTLTLGSQLRQGDGKVWVKGTT